MEYKWDKDLLKTLKGNEKVRSELSGIYQNNDNFFDYIYNILFYKKIMTINLNKDYFYMSNLDFYKPYVDKVIDEDLQLSTDNDCTYKNVFTDDEIVNITYDFYKNIVPQDIFDRFYKIFLQKNQNLEFKKFKKNDFFSGASYYSATADKFFIGICKTNSIEDITTLVHEYGHIIGCQGSFDIKNPNAEVESIFLELLSYDYFEKFDKYYLDNYNNRLAFYKSFIVDSYTIKDKFSINDIYKYIPEDKIFKFNYFIKHLSQCCNMDEKEIKDTLAIPFEDYYIYNYSTLIAMELYSIYQYDKKLAFELYRQIIKITSTNPEENYESIKKLGINLTENISSFTRKLER